MEKKFSSLSIFEFQERFPTEEACKEYLSELKFSEGFICPKCGHTHYCKGNREYDRQCTRCRHSESITSGTLFHKLKFPLLIAFYIVYYVSTTSKGISSTELSRKLALRQKTCWSFKQKVMKAMKSRGNHPLEGKVEVDETVVGGEEEGVRGTSKREQAISGYCHRKKGTGSGQNVCKSNSGKHYQRVGRFYAKHNIQAGIHKNR